MFSNTLYLQIFSKIYITFTLKK